MQSIITGNPVRDCLALLAQHNHFSTCVLAEATAGNLLGNYERNRMYLIISHNVGG